MIGFQVTVKNVEDAFLRQCILLILLLLPSPLLLLQMSTIFRVHSFPRARNFVPSRGIFPLSQNCDISAEFRGFCRS